METENARETKTTLVLGGTGKTGRRVVERLAARGPPTRVGSLSGEPAPASPLRRAAVRLGGRDDVGTRAA
jgi:uncharacterized protein YbjT (DUF2867 family)